MTVKEYLSEIEKIKPFPRQLRWSELYEGHARNSGDLECRCLQGLFHLRRSDCWT